MEREKLIVVGAGPAGIAAALAGATEGLNPLVIFKDFGGAWGKTCCSPNVAGFNPHLYPFTQLMMDAKRARKYGARFIRGTVSNVCDDTVVAHTHRKGDEVFKSDAVVLASGRQHKGIPTAFSGVPESMVGYDHPCWWKRHYNKHHIVLGCGNAGVQAAIWLHSQGYDVRLICRRPLTETTSHYLLEQINFPVVITNTDELTHVVNTHGHFIVDRLGYYGFDHLWFATGAEVDMLNLPTLKVNNRFQVEGHTSLFAVGDVSNEFRRASIAMGEGAGVISAIFACGIYKKQTM